MFSLNCFAFFPLIVLGCNIGSLFLFNIFECPGLVLVFVLVMSYPVSNPSGLSLGFSKSLPDVLTAMHASISGIFFKMWARVTSIPLEISAQLRTQGDKILVQLLGASPKICFASFLFLFLVFLHLLQKTYFDQRLECTAPECWSKYTTLKVFIIFLCSICLLRETTISMIYARWMLGANQQSSPVVSKSSTRGQI